MTVSIWQADDTQPIREVDVLIVGAGIVGCAAAVFAAQAGHTVTITEARDLALGASSRNAGFLITGPDTYYHRAIERWGHDGVRELWALSARTHAYWRTFQREGMALGIETPIEECGSMLLAESADEARELEDAARAMNRDGLDAEYVAGDVLRRGYHAAIRQPWDAAIHPMRLAEAMLAISGAELVTNNELYALEPSHAEFVIARTRRFIYHARHVLLCTNAYSVSIDPYFVGKVIPTRGQCLATAPLPERPIDVCGYSDYGFMYYRTTFDNRLLIGGARNRAFALEHDTTDDRITDPVQRALEAYLRARFPEVTAPIDRRWAGIMGFSADGLPLVGTLPHMPRVGFAVGFTGHGLSFGAGTAERAVDHLLKGADPGILHAARLE